MPLEAPPQESAQAAQEAAEKEPAQKPKDPAVTEYLESLGLNEDATAQDVETASKNLNYYKRLGLKPTASDEEIKKAYRKLSMKFHPDLADDKVIGGEVSRSLNAAFEVLSDPSKKESYDAYLAPELEPEIEWKDPGPSPFNDFGNSGYRGRRGSAGDPFTGRGNKNEAPPRGGGARTETGSAGRDTREKGPSKEKPPRQEKQKEGPEQESLRQKEFKEKNLKIAEQFISEYEGQVEAYSRAIQKDVSRAEVFQNGWEIRLRELNEKKHVLFGQKIRNFIMPGRKASKMRGIAEEAKYLENYLFDQQQYTSLMDQLRDLNTSVRGPKVTPLESNRQFYLFQSLDRLIPAEDLERITKRYNTINGRTNDVFDFTSRSVARLQERRKGLGDAYHVIVNTDRLAFVPEGK